jgi:hypothetical protein
MDEQMNGVDNKTAKIWIGIAVGTAIGVGIALSRRKRNRWDSARDMTRRVASHSNELSDSTRDIVERIKGIYEESCKVVEQAGELWANGRKLVGY